VQFNMRNWATQRTFPALYRIQIPLTLIMPC